MSTDIRIIPGIVRNGVVVPQPNSQLPDGAHVNIVLQPAEMTLELKEELEAWQRAGNEAWQMIDSSAVNSSERCVRRAFLTSEDPITGKSFEFRREWIRRRLELLSAAFGLDVLT